jgi:hypothetical protein
MTPPVTEAPMRLLNAAPGSKKPEPEIDEPVIVTVKEDRPAGTVALAEIGVAGGGAISLATAKP